MSKQSACLHNTLEQERTYNEKLKQALHSLNQMNASFIALEERLALQNARCLKVVSDMQQLQKSIIQRQSPQSKP